MYDLKPGQLIECEWIDPVVAGYAWVDAVDVDKLYKFLCRSVGYIHRVEPDGIILTACYGTDPNGERSLLLRQHLPWRCITNLWILEVQ